MGPFNPLQSVRGRGSFTWRAHATQKLYESEEPVSRHELYALGTSQQTIDKFIAEAEDYRFVKTAGTQLVLTDQGRRQVELVAGDVRRKLETHMQQTYGMEAGYARKLATSGLTSTWFGEEAYADQAYTVEGTPDDAARLLSKLNQEAQEAKELEAEL